MSDFVGDIEHKYLPDELLHEPKGAQLAEEGTVYVADGLGSGSFKKLPTASIEVTKVPVVSVVSKEIPDTDKVTSSLQKVATGNMKDVLPEAGVSAEFVDSINQNFAELYRVYTNQEEINRDIKDLMVQIVESLNKAIEALKGIGAAE